MNDQIGRPPRRPLAQPFSHASAATDEPSTERLLPVERLGSPFAVLAALVPATRSAGGGRRPR
ncbi:hypothetical protein [Kitasatospora sp. NPDC093102]|uniref:hypothetical protein n=1 Tax=Kitasatospora sp. NPDC093102 TaxID=3155069 RepID=UPI003431DA34